MILEKNTKHSNYFFDKDNMNQEQYMQVHYQHHMEDINAIIKQYIYQE